VIGQHPHEAKHGLAPLKRLRVLLEADKKHKIIAVGECGLDYFYNHSTEADQEKVLRYQIELALEYDLPLVFHVREAFDDFWPIFDSYPGARGELHSFTDNLTNLNKAISRGLYIGVNGIVTFTKKEWQLEVAQQIPLDKILLETDSPFLTPAPRRGTVNEPARVLLVADFLARLRGLSLEDLAVQTTTNARQVFLI
jgi:TatD DNase family protein